MGSLDKAILTGFICRLCSEMHRVVYHIYGEEGIRLSVSSKIHRYLSINVSRSDPLPKTICATCLERLENQHRLVQRIEHVTKILKGQNGKPNQSTEGCVTGLCEKPSESSDPPDDSAVQ